MTELESVFVREATGVDPRWQEYDRSRSASTGGRYLEVAMPWLASANTALHRGAASSDRYFKPVSDRVGTVIRHIQTLDERGHAPAQFVAKPFLDRLSAELAGEKRAFAGAVAPWMVGAVALVLLVLGFRR